MGRFTSGLDLYKHQKARFEAVARSARDMHYELAIEGQKDQVELTSGTISTKQLRSLGHPYGRRAIGKGMVRGSAPLLPINKQSGRLQGSIRIRGGKTATGQAFEVGPTSAAGKSIWAVAVGGTSRVVARGFWQEVKRRWRPRNKALIDVLRQRMRS